ncbi:MAG: pyrroline-5-carboxylate reductase [Actinomycetaceae bacterium]|nr:pyrroline-5-carboxylate reductase [Actinomycetaceae bacterium]
MLGFLGAGNMNGAIIRGVLDAGTYTADQIVFTSTDDASAQQLVSELGITRVPSNRKLVNALGEGGILVVGVKPNVIGEVLNEIWEVAAANHTVIVSIAAGTEISAIAEPLSAKQPIVRIMPNVAAQIGAGMSAICANEWVSSEQLSAVTDIFSAVGAVAQIAEKDFATFSAIASCSPAWTFTYIDALARAALAHGIPKTEAVRIAAQAVQGSAQLVLEKLSQAAPANLVDQVTSPGGTTIAGLLAMEEAGFSAAVVTGVDAAIARDNEIQAGA